MFAEVSVLFCHHCRLLAAGFVKQYQRITRLWPALLLIVDWLRNWLVFALCAEVGLSLGRIEVAVVV